MNIFLVLERFIWVSIMSYGEIHFDIRVVWITSTFPERIMLAIQDSTVFSFCLFGDAVRIQSFIEWCITKDLKRADHGLKDVLYRKFPRTIWCYHEKPQRCLSQYWDRSPVLPEHSTAIEPVSQRRLSTECCLNTGPMLAVSAWGSRTLWDTRKRLTLIIMKHRNRLNLVPALILALTKIRPLIEVQACQKQAQSSH
jgi:hypothetical protein